MMLNIYFSEWPHHKSRHRALFGGRNVKRGKLRSAAGGPEVLGAEVDDSKLDKTPQTLRTILPHSSLCWRVAIDSNPESEVKSRTHVRSVVSSGTHFQGKTLSIETSKDEIESLDVGQRLNQKAIITGKRLAVLTLVENS